MKDRDLIIGFIKDTLGINAYDFNLVKNRNYYEGSLEKDLFSFNMTFAESVEWDEIDNYRRSEGKIKKITLKDLKDNNLLRSDGEINYRIILEDIV